MRESTTSDVISRRTALTGLGCLVSAVGLNTISRVSEGSPDPTAVRNTMRAAQQYLLSNRQPDGDHWESPISEYGDQSDVRATVYYLILMTDLEVQSRAEREALNYVLDARKDGAGWGDASINFGVRYVLRERDSGEHTDAIDDITAEIEAEEMAITGSQPVETRRAEAGPFDPLLQIKLMFGLVNDRYTVAELFPKRGYESLTSLLALTPAFDMEDGIDPTEPLVHQAFIASLLSFATMGEVIRERRGDGQRLDGRLLSEALADVLERRRLPNGVWGPPPDTMFGSLALSYATGYQWGDRALTLPIEWIREQRQADDGQIIAFRMPTWDTALAVRALRSSGYPLDHPVVQRGGQYLADVRTTAMSRSPLDTPLDRLPLPFRSNYGNGWGYTPYMFSDWDDTGIVVSVLSEFGERLVDDDVELLLDVQNQDGSWSAYVTDFDPLSSAAEERVRENFGEYAYEFLFTTHGSPDVTSHVLEGLGRMGYTVDNSDAVKNAVDYFRGSQRPNDMWLGVWGAGYTYGTAAMLLGMDEANADMDQSFVREGIDALLDIQFDSGGWGDDSAWDYVQWDIPYVTNGPKAAHTGWAIQGLLAAGLEPTHNAIQNGVSYLIDRQQSDGSWVPRKIGANFGPPFYRNSIATQSAALRGLSYYARNTGIALPEPV